MKKTISTNKILALVLVLGFFCALVLCGIRTGLEAEDTDVCVVMSTRDLARLSAAPSGVRAFDGGNILDGALLLVEDENQYSHNPIEGNYLPDALGPDRALRQVRCFYLYPQFAARYRALGYSGAEEIENILYRAVTDRNIRVLWLTPFTDAETGEAITDVSVYNAVLQNLAPRLARHGLTLGGSFSVFPAYTPSPVLIAGVFFGVCAAGLLLLMSLCKLPRRLWLLCFLGIPLGLWKPDFFIPVFALAASVLFPCLSLKIMTGGLQSLENRSLARNLGSYLAILSASVGVSLMGGLFVGALQSGTNYLLAIDNFRGVKVSQLLPIAFAVFIVVRCLCPLKEILAGRKFIIVLCALLLVGGVGYYILRTGNASVGVLEQRLRNTLEHLLVARPRTKEFLVAWPCVAVAALLVMKGKRAYAWPFAILSSAGFASAVNTFCHSRSPLWLSLTRTLLGFILGAALGCILLAITYRPSSSAS